MLIAVLIMQIILTLALAFAIWGLLLSWRDERKNKEKFKDIQGWFKHASTKEIEEQLGKRAIMFRKKECLSCKQSPNGLGNSNSGGGNVA